MENKTENVNVFEEAANFVAKCKAQYGLVIVENRRLKKEIEMLKAKLKMYESKAS